MEGESKCTRSDSGHRLTRLVCSAFAVPIDDDDDASSEESSASDSSAEIKETPLTAEQIKLAAQRWRGTGMLDDNSDGEVEYG